MEVLGKWPCPRPFAFLDSRTSCCFTFWTAVRSITLVSNVSLSFLASDLMSWFNLAAGNYALDSCSLIPPLHPRREGEEKWTKGKTCLWDKDCLIREQSKYKRGFELQKWEKKEKIPPLCPAPFINWAWCLWCGIFPLASWLSVWLCSLPGPAHPLISWIRETGKKSLIS